MCARANLSGCVWVYVYIFYLYDFLVAVLNDYTVCVTEELQ